MAGILKVDKYQDFNGNDIMTSDGSGTITMPSGIISGQNFPAFQALLSGDQNISDNVSTRINYDTEVFNTDSAYDNATNYRFTPTVAGKYCFYVQARVAQNSGSIDQIVQSTLLLRKNGTGVAQRYDNFNSHFVCFFTQNISAIVEANGTTDYFDVAVQCDVISGSVNVGGGSGGQSIFSAYRIGA